MQTTTTGQHSPRSITPLGFILMVLLWGSFPVAAKIGTEHVPPLLLSSARFLLASGLMTLIVFIQRKKLWITRRQHWQVFLVSLFMVGIPASLFFASLPYAPVGVLTLMWATTPIFTAIFNVRGAGEVRGWRLLASLLIGAVGIVIVLMGRVPFWPGNTDNAFAFASGGAALVSELTVLGSAVVYGFGMRLAKYSSPDVPVTIFTMWQVFYSGAFIGLLGLIFEWNSPFQPDWTSLGMLLYLAIFCSCLTFFLMFWLIRRIGAIRTAYADFIIPGVTLALSYFMLGESVTLAKTGGFVLVMLGCVLVEM